MWHPQIHANQHLLKIIQKAVLKVAQVNQWHSLSQSKLQENQIKDQISKYCNRQLSIQQEIHLSSKLNKLINNFKFRESQAYKV